MLLTLVVVPVVYTLLDDILILVRRLPDLSRRLRGQTVEFPGRPPAAANEPLSAVTPVADDEE